jgi:hypothetical protein
LLRNNKTAKTGFPISRLAAQIWEWKRCRSKAFFAAQKSAFFVFLFRESELINIPD